jgi:formylglycine-generating enzyme required for sulfatase activity
VRILWVSLRLIQIPVGDFLMGSPEDEPERHSDEGPQHLVAVQEFFMAPTPITQAQWREVASWQEREAERWGRELNPNPSPFGERANSDQRPVENVSWLDAMEFCNRLSQRTGRHCTLPSEAQWEYACRAGTATPFAFGATLTAELANYDASTTYADGPKREYLQQTTPVGLSPANAWGLHDMHGNVWEWCLDHWHASYEGAPADGSAWLKPSATDEEERLPLGLPQPQPARLCQRRRWVPCGLPPPGPFPQSLNPQSLNTGCCLTLAVWSAVVGLRLSAVRSAPGAAALGSGWCWNHAR